MAFLKNILLILLFFLISHNGVVAHTYLVFGGRSGWIGQKIVVLLEDEGHAVYCANSRLEDRTSIEGEIRGLRPDFIINAAGIIGKPNVDWCQTHKEETIRSNVLGLINLIDVAFLHNIHVTNISTGCIYQYDDNHPIYSNKGFTEEDEPNFAGSFYSRTKILAEKVILCYPNVLNLRLRMPLSYDLSPRSFIGKIINYKTLISVPNSMSVLEDLLPLIPRMCDRYLTGNYNFVNPGTISHKEIIDLYKKYINPHHIADYITLDEQHTILNVPRSNSELSADKLLKEFPDIPHIQDAVVLLFQHFSTYSMNNERVKP